MTSILKRSFLLALGAFAYVVAIATLIYNLGRMFPGPDDAATAPIIFLLLLVVSVATMGMLMFGAPVMLYLDGKKREALLTAVCTDGFLAAFAMAYTLGLAAMRA